MTGAIATAPMTVEDFLALPENGMDRWLIHGELREKPMTIRNRFHNGVVARVTYALIYWARHRAPSRGEVFTCETGVRFRGPEDSAVGIDVIYVSAEVMDKQSDATTLIDGIPTLAVEVLSPSDTIEEINEKIDLYLEAGVPLIWVIEPRRKTVDIYRPGQEPTRANRNDRLSGEPHLPGFDIPAAEIFE